MPTAALNQIEYFDDIWDLVVNDVIGTVFPEFSEFDLGYIDPERVPCERVVNGQQTFERSC